MHEYPSVLGPWADHSEVADPLDASNCLIFGPDTTKRWLLKPEETSVFTPLFDVHKQPAIIAVPDSKVRISACRDSITEWRVFRCDYCDVVAECLYLFTAVDVPDDRFVVVGDARRDETNRARSRPR
jgi:hypothetical protein